ncbi:MAG: hypothetical protein HZB46_13895 [Solirubrobacterales bacterium]|nr:hypothetical protein [Solirubrobacterales bacterium]
MRTTLLSLLALLVLAPAAGAKVREMDYWLSFHATMKEEWSFEQHARSECENGDCLTDEVGKGQATITLGTSVPRKVHVMSMGGKVQPMIDTGVNRGLPLVGEELRSGTHTVTYSGDPKYDAANPDEVADTSKCGRRTLRTDLAFGWDGPNRLTPSVIVDPLLEGCPTGPPRNEHWVDDEVPSLFGLAATIQQTKFARTKQFTVRGSKTFTGVIDAANDPRFTRSGHHLVTWRWEARFTVSKPKPKKRRR